MFYKYFIVTPDYKVKEYTANDLGVVEDHAQIVYGTNDKLEYEDYTVYFNNTKVGSANFAVGNIGAYGTLVFCIGKDSDDVRMITQHFRRLESDEEYKGLFSKENASGITTLEVFNDLIMLEIGKNPITETPRKKDNEQEPRPKRLSIEETKIKTFNKIALFIRKWLIEHDMLDGSFIVFCGKGYIRHWGSKDEDFLMTYEQKISADEPKEFSMIVGLSNRAAERAKELAGEFLYGIDGLGIKLTIENVNSDILNETTWIFRSDFYDSYEFEQCYNTEREDMQ